MKTSQPVWRIFDKYGRMKMCLEKSCGSRTRFAVRSAIYGDERKKTAECYEFIAVRPF